MIISEPFIFPVITFDPLNRLLAILILGTFLFQLGVKTGIMLWFQANKTYISTVLCENRDRPKLHCGGQCMLAKKLREAENEQENEPLPFQTINNEIAPCVVGLEQHFDPISGVQRNFSHYRLSYSFQFHSNTFHPPPVV